MSIFYFLIALSATFIGSMSGFGGGVIIKPILDALGDYDTYVIGTLSSATILCMAIISTLTSKNSLKSKNFFNKRIIFLLIGSLFGGYIGRQMFVKVFSFFDSGSIEIIQASFLIVLLIVILFKNLIPNHNVTSLFISFLTGLFLGTLSAFLGIGGGPFNVAILCILFSMDIKSAATTSILIILFTQTVNIVTTAVTTGFGTYDYNILIYMITGGILGGFFGAKANQKATHALVEKIYFIVIILLIILNIYNIVFTLLN